MKQLRIMFVCHGNICRSPMAEFIMKELLAEAGLAETVTVASGATGNEEICMGIGNPVYPPAKVELARHGISCEGKRAVQLRQEDGSDYDLFVGMDDANIRNMKRILGEEMAGKIHRLMDYTERGGQVADPWYSDRFDIAYRDIREGCEGLLRAITEELEK